MESLLVNKTKLVSDEVGLELLPTYSFGECTQNLQI